MGSCSRKPHLVIVAFPAQGHVTPMMQSAKLFHSKGFHVTFVNTEFNHRRLLRSHGPDALNGLPDFRFEAIPDGMPPSDRDATQEIPELCDSIGKNCAEPLKELIKRLNSGGDVPPVSWIVSDGVASFGTKAGRDLGIPYVQLWTASACSFMAYLHYQNFLEKGIIPFPDEKYLHDGTLDTPVDWIPGLRSVRYKDMPSFMRIQSLDDIMFNYLGSEARNCLNSSAILFNTFDELDREVLEAISVKFPNIYTIGPLPLLGKDVDEMVSSSLWKEDSRCLEWLDTKEPNSVVYVNYGSITTMTDYHFKEFAWGLAKSGYSFLWIVRPDVVEGSDSAVLPEEFLAEVEGRALLASWCPQKKVLDHPSVAVFLTHCGWNSTLEAVGAGVPIIGWPFFADQQTNCRYSCANWGTGMEIDENVNRDDVAKIVKEMMEGESGKRMRDKALEWKSKAVEATDVGGSSYNNFDRFIKEAFNYSVDEIINI